MEGWTDVRTYVHDVMAIKPNFLAPMGYHIFLTMVLRARAPSAHGALLIALLAEGNRSSNKIVEGLIPDF